MTRSILVVSHEFYPSSAIPAQRISKFCRFLPQFGVDCTVVAGRKVTEPSQAPVEQSFAELFSGPGMSAPNELGFGGSRVFQVRYNDWYAMRLHRKVSDAAQVRPSWALIGARKALSFYTVRNFLSYKEWVPAAVRHAGRLTAERSFHCVLTTTGADVWNLEAAYRISRAAGLPLLIDFRDGWDWHYFNRGRKATIYRRMRRYIAAAHCFTCATRSVADELQTFWRLPSDRVHVLFNGFDPLATYEALASCRAAAPSERPVFGYFGWFTENSRWSALMRLIAECWPGARFIFRGREFERFSNMVESTKKLEFDIGPHVERQELLRLFSQTQCHIISTPEDRDGCLPTKLTDAIGLSKPFILIASTERSYLDDFLKPCSVPYLIFTGAEDADEMAAALGPHLSAAVANSSLEELIASPYCIVNSVRELATIVNSM